MSPRGWPRPLFSGLREVYSYGHIYSVILMGFVTEVVKAAVRHFELEAKCGFYKQEKKDKSHADSFRQLSFPRQIFWNTI